MLLLIVARLLKQKRKRKIRRRSIREKQWLRRRQEKGVFRELLEELRLEDPEHYRRYLRIDTATFEVLIILKFVTIFEVVFSYFLILKLIMIMKIKKKTRT